MSADTRPISPTQFALALQDLSQGTLRLKVLEMRNSIAHLHYSNEQMRPFAEGSCSVPDAPGPPQPDQDCIDAIAENEAVVERMQRRLSLVRHEVDKRGLSWADFEALTPRADQAAAQDDPALSQSALPQSALPQSSDSLDSHPAWSDGTFQTGTIRHRQFHYDDSPPLPLSNASGGNASRGTFSDLELRHAIEQQIQRFAGESSASSGGDGQDHGLHL